MCLGCLLLFTAVGLCHNITSAQGTISFHLGEASIPGKAYDSPLEDFPGYGTFLADLALLRGRKRGSDQ